MDNLVELLRLIPAIPGYVLTALQAVYWGGRLVAGWLRRSRPLPAAKIDRRLKLRAEFEKHLGKPGKYGTYGEAVVRDIDRVDQYPSTEKRPRRISPWFKTEINGLYHRGVELILSMPTYAAPDHEGGGWHFVHYDDQTQPKTPAFPVGRIPFDFMERVDWDGDEYDYIPHIYCRFDGPYGEPYEEVIYKGRLYPPSEVLFEMEGLSRQWGRWGPMKRATQRTAAWTRRQLRRTGD
jgi:hypothetical protein